MNLELVNICKKYSRKEILKNLSLTFSEGKIQALMGENGAGKSTTANIISGVIQPDSGFILIDGKKVNITNSKKALDLGISYVQQRPLLCDSLTIKENLLIGLKKDFQKNIPQISKVWLKDIEINTLVKDVSSDLRFFISLAGELLKEPQVLILDEPTALLNNSQRDYLFTQLKILASQNMNIIVITHYKEEAIKYCNSITFLEEGSIVKKIKQYQEEKESVKKSVKIDSIKSDNNFPEYELKIENLCVYSKNQNPLHNISFTCKSGNITLIQGLGEDGIKTLEDSLCGMKKANSGYISLKNINTNERLFYANLKKSNYNTYSLRKKMGIKIAIIPTNKKFRGSNPNITISQMLFEKNHLIEKAQVNISAHEKAENLSGGMLQKLLFAREFSNKPDLLILCHPLQGLDALSMERNIEIINNAVEKGAMAVILTAGDFPAENKFCTSRFFLRKGKLLDWGKNNG